MAKVEKKEVKEVKEVKKEAKAEVNAIGEKKIDEGQFHAEKK